MGLAERKIKAEIESYKIPNAVKALKLTAPYAEIAVEIDWPSVENDADGIKFLHDQFGSLWGPLDFAIKKIAKDQVGKDAIKDGLKSMKFINRPELPETKYSVAEKTLVVEIPLKNKKLTTLPGVHDALMAGL